VSQAKEGKNVHYGGGLCKRGVPEFPPGRGKKTGKQGDVPTAREPGKKARLRKNTKDDLATLMTKNARIGERR